MKREVTLKEGLIEEIGVPIKLTFKNRVDGYKYRLYIGHNDGTWYFYRGYDNHSDGEEEYLNIIRGIARGDGRSISHLLKYIEKRG